MTLADCAAAFTTGAVSGALAATGIGVGAATAINAATTFSASVGADMLSGRSVDWGKAITSTVCSIASSLWGGNGIRHSKGSYKQALSAVDSAKKIRLAAPRGAARKAANVALNSARKTANIVYLDESYVLLGKTLVSGIGTTAVLSGYSAMSTM